MSILSFVRQALLTFAAVAATAGSAHAALLPSWNFNLGSVGGTDATAITSITVVGTAQIDQEVYGYSGLGNPFSMSGSLSWLQYDQGADSSLFVLPAGYSDLYLRFDGLTGILDPLGDAAFDTGSGLIGLYLANDGYDMELAIFRLANESSATDIAYFDGGGYNPFYHLNFELVSGLANLFADENGTPLQPGSVLSFDIDGRLDSDGDYPSFVAGGDGVSTSRIVSQGNISALDAAALPPTGVPEPSIASLLLLAVLSMTIVNRRRRTELPA